MPAYCRSARSILFLLFWQCICYPLHAQEQALSTCLAHERIGLAVGQRIEYLNRESRPGNYTSHILSVAEQSIRESGGALTPLRAPPLNTGEMALAGPLDEAEARRATILLALTLIASEKKLTSIYLTGDQSPLRTVSISVQADAVDVASRNYLSDKKLQDRNYATASIDAALEKLDSNDIKNLVASSLQEACTQKSLLVDDANKNLAPPAIAKQPSSASKGSITALEKQQQALKMIADFADRFCKDVPLAGQSSVTTISGGADLQISALLKSFVDLNIGGNADHRQASYQGVLQRDLPTVLKQQGDCRGNILKYFSDSNFFRGF